MKTQMIMVLLSSIMLFLMADTAICSEITATQNTIPTQVAQTYFELLFQGDIVKSRDLFHPEILESQDEEMSSDDLEELKDEIEYQKQEFGKVKNVIEVGNSDYASNDTAYVVVSFTRGKQMIVVLKKDSDSWKLWDVMEK